MLLKGTSTEIPDSLVTHSLDLNYSNVTELPSGLHVLNDVYLHSSKIIQLPNDLVVGGGLDLRNTGIATLPSGLKVGAWLDLINTPLTQLPQCLTVGGWLDITNTEIDTLPHSVMFGDLYAGDGQLSMDEPTQFKIIKQDMKMYSFIKSPTNKSTRLHAMLWEI